MNTVNRSLLLLPLVCGALQACIKDTATIYVIDDDGDGVGGSEILGFVPPEHGKEGRLTGEVDCNDEDASVFPGAADGSAVCDGVDNDCDQEIDEDIKYDIWYTDADHDGYAVDGTETTLSSCDDTTGYAQQVGDCDDGSADAYPGGEDLDCTDDIDGDCDGVKACALEGTVDVSDLASAGKTGGWQVAGASIAIVGDVDGDGLPDVAVGYPSGNMVSFVNGVTGTPIAGMSISGGTGTEFGAAVAAGDFNADGTMDLAVGAPGVAPGEVTIWLGPDFVASSHTISGISGEYLFGFVITTVAASSGAEGICSADEVLGTGDKADKYYAYCFDDPSTTDSAGDVAAIGGGVEVAEGWPLALAAAPDGSALAMGNSGGESHGSKVYGIPYDSAAGYLVSFVTGSSTAGEFGASVALADVDSSGDLDLLVGAPGAGLMYGMSDPAARSDAYGVSDANLTWTGTAAAAFGAGIGLLGDLTGDLTGVADTTLAIGGADTLWLFRGTTSGSTTTYASTTADATATITGFAGPVRTILNPGDVNDDGFDDVLVCDGTNVTLLFGGPLPPAE